MILFSDVLEWPVREIDIPWNILDKDSNSYNQND